MVSDGGGAVPLVALEALWAANEARIASVVDALGVAFPACVGESDGAAPVFGLVRELVADYAEARELRARLEVVLSSLN